MLYLPVFILRGGSNVSEVTMATATLRTEKKKVCHFQMNGFPPSDSRFILLHSLCSI